MKEVTLFSLDTPYREKFDIKGFEFGDADAPLSVAIVGSMRGNEIQQTYICADMVRHLKGLETAGMIMPGKRVLVVPACNAFSMNISHRFWPMDNTDINRMFPGYDQGETTQRIADGIFRAIKDCEFGIQLCSYYLPGDFIPHVRVTDTGCVNREKIMVAAEKFGLPYAMVKDATPFDTTTLNYNWQVWETAAFSVYSSETDYIDEMSAASVERAILRFLHEVGVSMMPADGKVETRHILEHDLENVRTSRAGFFRRTVELGTKVKAGDILAEVLSTDDCAILERLKSPIDGRVFFYHVASLINAETIAFKVIPAKSES